MTVPPRSLSTLPGVLLLALLLALLAPVAPARALSAGYLCTGYVSCAQAGYPHYGYKQASDRMWWRMFSGHNCTNYVAYRLVDRGMSAERPWGSTGMAYNWGRANRHLTDDTPTVGSVAWWNAGDGVGSSGHVAYVEEVVSRRKIVVSEDSWGGDFDWRVITKDGGRWPTGFIHFMDEELKAVQSPAVSGTPAVGRSLTADPGKWSPAGSYDLQWLADGQPIEGATAASFTPGPELVRSRLSVRVSATAKGYSPTVATSERTERVQRGDMTVGREPVLSGTPRVDEVLTLDPGTVAPSPELSAIRWFADGDPIKGQSGTRLRLGQGQIQQQITAVVVSRTPGYRRLRVPTEATAPVRAGRIQVSEPFTLTGRARLDRTLTAQPGTFAPAEAEVTHTWLRDGEPIAGATGPTYTPGVDDVGHEVTVRVDLRHTGYRDLSRTLTPAGRVTTKPELSLRTVGRKHRAVVRLAVEAPGVADPGGEATVRLGRGTRVRTEVADGVARVVLRGLSAGNRRVRVRYHGTDVVLPGRARSTVRVLR